MDRPPCANIAPKNKPELAALIEGSIGELSPFHQTCGFYVDGVHIADIVLPAGWAKRAVIVENANTNGIRGLCLEPGDPAVSKLSARRAEGDLVQPGGLPLALNSRSLRPAA